MLGALALPAVPAMARANAYATVTSTAGALNVRSGPGTTYPRLRTLANHTRVTPSCQRTGSRVTGPVRTTNLWDRLPGGGYVSDAYLRWRPGRPALPACAAATAGGSGTPTPLPSPTPTPSPVPPMTHAQFIAAVSGPARATALQYRVPASVTLAQAILESGWGASGLSTNDRNYFGIKCFNGLHGPIAIGCHN